MDLNNINYHQMNMFQKISFKVVSFFKHFPKRFVQFFVNFAKKIKSIFVKFYFGIRKYISNFIEGNVFTKVSYVILGIGFIRAKQYVKGIICVLIEGLFIFLFITFMIPNLSKMRLDNLVEAIQIYNPVTGKNEWNNYDNAFLVLLYSIISIVLIVGYICLHVLLTFSAYNVEMLEKKFDRINKEKYALDDKSKLKTYINEKVRQIEDTYKIKFTELKKEEDRKLVDLGARYNSLEVTKQTKASYKRDAKEIFDKYKCLSFELSKLKKEELSHFEVKKVNNISQDAKEFVDKKFHITLLGLPVLGILVFTLIPLLFMIFVAFTNYDADHLPPSQIFQWVGFTNFASLFSGEISTGFSYAFGKVFWWTIVWAIFATFTNYIGGILLALLINNKRTKIKKFWRTIFVITIAIPQFVSLMLIRYFLADYGIVNTILSNIGFIDFARSIGLIKATADFLPFLSDPNWIKVTVIVVNMWVGFPYLMLIATGILMNIPEDLYESARIDGAGKTTMFMKITMPYMLFVTGPYLITSFVNNLNNFNVIYLLTSGYSTHDVNLGAASATEADLLVTWLFKLTQDSSNYKIASVIGIIIFVISAVFTLIAFNIVSSRAKEEKFQ